MATIASQIEVAEKAVTKCEERLDKIERSIRLKDLSDKEIQELVTEEQQVKKRLKECEKRLKGLRKENGKNTVISVIILAVLGLLYYFFWVS